MECVILTSVTIQRLFFLWQLSSEFPVLYYTLPLFTFFVFLSFVGCFCYSFLSTSIFLPVYAFQYTWYGHVQRLVFIQCLWIRTGILKLCSQKREFVKVTNVAELVWVVILLHKFRARCACILPVW